MGNFVLFLNYGLMYSLKSLFELKGSQKGKNQISVQLQYPLFTIASRKYSSTADLIRQS